MKLSQTHLDDFNRDGFLVVNDVLTETDRAPLFAEYAELINRVAVERGVAGTEWGTLTFEQRFTQLVAKDPNAYEFLDISLPLTNELTNASGMHMGPAVFDLLTHPNILDIAESVIGPEVISNPVQHARIKPPEAALNSAGAGNSNMGRTGWHQDAAVVLENAEASPILTVWVAMTNATPEMGCMRAVPGSHLWNDLGQHCPGKTGTGEIFIPRALVGDQPQVDLSVRAGGVVLLHKKTWHGAGPNKTNDVRWSFDLRFQPPGYATGRECFPEFLARSTANPHDVITKPSDWFELWRRAREDISNGTRRAVFNERWEKFNNDPMCA